MGDIVSGITDALGLTNTSGEQADASASEAASKASTQMSAAQIAFNQQQLAFQESQYSDWKSIYGSVEQNVGNYFNTLTPELLTAQGLQNQQSAFQQTQQATKQQFAQSGMANSGLEESTLANQTFANASTEASIRTSAPQQVAQEQEGFIGLGLGQGTSELATIANAGNTASQGYTAGVTSQASLSASDLAQATNQSIANMESTGDFLGSVAGAGASMYNFGQL